jgi:PhnB protein
VTDVSTSPQQLCPYLVVKGAKAAIDFYARAFGATVDFALTDPSDGRIGHAELRFGATRLFLADEYPDFGAVGPDAIGGSPVKLHLDVADVDAFVARAVLAGAAVLRCCALRNWNSTATAPRCWLTPSATAGSLRAKWRRSARKRCKGAGTPWRPASERRARAAQRSPISPASGRRARLR